MLPSFLLPVKAKTGVLARRTCRNASNCDPRVSVQKTWSAGATTLAGRVSLSSRHGTNPSRMVRVRAALTPFTTQNCELSKQQTASGATLLRSVAPLPPGALLLLPQSRRQSRTPTWPPSVDPQLPCVFAVAVAVDVTPATETRSLATSALSPLGTQSLGAR